MSHHISHVTSELSHHITHVGHQVQRQIVTGYWKTDQNVTLGLFHLLAQLIDILIHYPSTVALTGLADWSVFLELVLLTM